jgi:hypothetical protein
MPKRGGSRGRKRPTLGDVTRRLVGEDDINSISAELLSGNDRTCAIVACELVNTSLMAALTAHFVQLEEGDGESLFFGQAAVLGSFSARIVIGRAIGVFGNQTFEVLQTVRRIRNAFAHSALPVEFTLELIANECMKLPDEKLSLSRELKAQFTDVAPLRERYVAVCLHLIALLQTAARELWPRTSPPTIPDGHDGLPSLRDISVPPRSPQTRSQA